MNIPIPKGFNPVRGLIASSVCFLVSLFGWIAFFLLFIMFGNWQSGRNICSGFQDFLDINGTILIRIFNLSFVFACFGWLTCSIKIRKQKWLIWTFVQLLIAIFAIEWLCNSLDLNPFKHFNIKPPVPFSIRLLEAEFFPFLATVFLTSLMFAKSFWYKGRSIVNATNVQ